jgi:hypothetical protein
VEHRFGAYDWQNKDDNIREYGEQYPPLYSLDKVLYFSNLEQKQVNQFKYVLIIDEAN